MEVLRESDITLKQHARLAVLFRATLDPRSFPGCVSWAGARPEHRVVATVDGVIVGHTGILAKEILVDGTAYRAGQTGLISLDPRFADDGVAGLVQEATNARLATMDIDFGYANVAQDAVGHHTWKGWTHLPGASTRVFFPARPLRARQFAYPVVVLPVRAPVEPLLTAKLFDLNGFEL